MARLKIHFDFGWHIVKGDATGLRKQLAAFKPQVYIIENHALPRPASGKNNMLDISFGDVVSCYNKLVERARKNDFDAKQALRNIAKGTLEREALMAGFKEAEHEAIVDSYRLAIFFLETHGEGAHVSQLAQESEAANALALANLFKLQLDRAIAQFTKAIDLAVENYSLREANIKGNLPAIQENLVKTFDRLATADEIRVFVRYGIVHTSLYSAAVGLGIESTQSYDAEGDSTENAATRFLMTRPNSIITDDILLTALFENALASAFLTGTYTLAAREVCVGEPSTGLAYRKAKAYIQGRSNGDLERLFESYRDLELKQAIIHLVVRLVEEGAIAPQQSQQALSL